MNARYIPALSFRWLTPFYDPLLKWGMREEAFKGRLILQMGLQPGMEVLDVGCGTGTLTLMIKRAQPAAALTGLDGDPQVLEIARRKTGGGDIRWDLGLASRLPYLEAAFDRVVTSLVIHHLSTSDKRLAFEEAWRVLKPLGELHILDFGPPHSLLARFMAGYMRRLEHVADNFDGHLAGFVREAGFIEVEETGHFLTAFGPACLWVATKGK